MSYVVRAIAVVLIATLVAGCDFSPGGGENPPVFQTEILEVRVEPNPVAVGDTTTLTVIIEDSLDTSFRFSWFIPGPDTTTEINQLLWIADIDPGTHSAVVSADNGNYENSRQPVAEEFIIEVVE
jgi:hypothetical protein